MFFDLKIRVVEHDQMKIYGSKSGKENWIRICSPTCNQKFMKKILYLHKLVTTGILILNLILHKKSRLFLLLLVRVADQVHFLPDPDPANQNLKNRIHLWIYHITQISYFMLIFLTKFFIFLFTRKEKSQKS